MGTTPLKRFLQSLCDHSCWNYAVFWKLQQQSQMILMWEDGYFGTLKVQDSMENIYAETRLGSLEETSSCNTYNGALGGDAVELAVSYMSSFQYTLGDGVVGDVAYTGNHRWVFAGSKSSDEFNAPLIPEHADEWLFQFAAGVKTILLVPVIPHGVLQLGSLEDLPEDAEMANYIKDEFFAHQYFMNEPSSLMPTTMKSFDEFPSFSENGTRRDDSTSIDNVKWSNHKPLTWYSSHVAGTDMLKSLAGAQLGAIEFPDPRHPSTNLSKSTSLEEEVPVISNYNSSAEYADRPLRSEILMKQPLVSDISPSLSFPKECELHKALGPAFMGKENDSYMSIGEDTYSHSSQICSKLIDSSSVQNLLSNVVTSVHLGESSHSNSFGQFASFGKKITLNKKSAFGGESSLFRNHVDSAFVSRVRNFTDSSSASATSYEGIVNELTEEDEQKSSYDVVLQRKSSKPSVASKRRGKPGAKQKPRPRDRQLIQDRLKELRELVPDGAKCSIDGLLDRTVTHMLFLKSVGDRAIKLRQCAQPEGVGTGLKNNTTPEDKGSQNGASWAFELGADQNICPIIVEDLQHPGHMIIEMICDEGSRFLDIAEVIHGLNLTILKGMMEMRSGNTWACFVIEAPTGFHRLDIFWPLMKLLQQQHSQTPICSKI